jgi:hypothetical protein
MYVEIDYFSNLLCEQCQRPNPDGKLSVCRRCAMRVIIYWVKVDKNKVAEQGTIDQLSNLQTRDILYSYCSSYYCSSVAIYWL